MARIALLLLCSSIGTVGVGSEYVTGFYRNTNFEAFNSLFADYLTEKVGSTLDPPVNFSTIPARQTGYKHFDELITAGEIDFSFAPAVLTACQNTLYDSIPLATARAMSGEDEWAGAIFAMKNNTALSKLEDIVGKRIAAASHVSLVGWSLQADRCAGEGIHVFSAAKQVQFFPNDIERLVESVVSGDADVGFMEWGMVSRRTADAASQMHVIAQLETPGISLPHSTDTAPEFAFSALPHVPPEVRFKVTEALLSVPLEHAALGEAGVGFKQLISALSYDSTRSVLQTQNVLVRQADGSWTCRDKAPDVWDAIQCPPGAYKRPLAALQSGCADRNISCPPGATCVCSPCLFSDQDVEVHMHGLDVDLYHENETLCQRSAVCGLGTPHQVMNFVIVDNLLRPSARVTYEMIVFTANDVLAPKHGEANRSAALPHVHSFSLAIEGRGMFVLQVSLDGEQAPASPFYVLVRPAACEEQDSVRETDDGECVCRSGFGSLRGRCERISTLILMFGVPALALLLLLGFLFVRYKIRRADSLWLLDPADVIFTDPPRVLGFGTNEVWHGVYLGTEVAVKVMSKREHPSAHHERIPSRTASSTLDPLMPRTSDLMRRRLLNIAEIQAARLPGGRYATREGSVSSQDILPHTPSTGPDAGEGERGGIGRSTSEGERGGVGRSTSQPRRSVSLSGHPTGRHFSDEDASMTNSVGWTMPSHHRTSPHSSSSLHASKQPCAGRLLEFFGLGGSWYGRQHFISEMRLIARLRHPRITTVMGAVIQGNQTMMVMEIMYYGSLQDLYLNAMIEFDGDSVLQLLCDITAGMDFLHSHTPAICHGDLKASNILVDDQLRAKVADFGMAFRKRGVGTPYWMAPELLEGGRSTLAADVYAFGITLVEVLSRALPYTNRDPLQVLSGVVDPAQNLRPTLPPGCGPELAVLINKCWVRDPGARPSMNEVNAMVEALDMSQFAQLWTDKQDRWLAQRIGARRNSSAILYNMFPKHVADAIMRGEKAPEDRRECSTVFFSDIVGFTKLSSQLESHQVSEMLERLFSKVDEAAAKHAVYQLETIGDCYIAVTNLVTDQDGDHVARMAAFSLDVMEVARNTLIDPADHSKGHVIMRAGFDSGPIVGNVVGSKHKKYTVFGNTVNTASRMESTGVAMRVQCTKRSADLLRVQNPAIVLEERGQVAVKGRGSMETYFLKDEEGIGPLQSVEEEEQQRPSVGKQTSPTAATPTTAVAAAAHSEAPTPSPHLASEDPAAEVSLAGVTMNLVVDEVVDDDSAVPSPIARAKAKSLSQKAQRSPATLSLGSEAGLRSGHEFEPEGGAVPDLQVDTGCALPAAIVQLPPPRLCDVRVDPSLDLNSETVSLPSWSNQLDGVSESDRAEPGAGVSQGVSKLALGPADVP